MHTGQKASFRGHDYSRISTSALPSYPWPARHSPRGPISDTYLCWRGPLRPRSGVQTPHPQQCIEHFTEFSDRFFGDGNPRPGASDHWVTGRVPMCSMIMRIYMFTGRWCPAGVCVALKAFRNLHLVLLLHIRAVVSLFAGFQSSL